VKANGTNGNGANGAGDSIRRRAVILAGGRGTRLAPYTTVLPKPLLPIGDAPILDVVIRQLSGYGFMDITLAVGYLAHLIEAVLQDGSRHGVSLMYHWEAEPLGTVGPLASMEHLDDTFLMMNGDVLTTLNYGELYAAHLASGNLLTVATHIRTVRSDYGVLELDGDNGWTRRVTGFREKPEFDHSVSMGVYVVDSRAREYIPSGQPFDLPQLVWRLLEAGERVGSYAYDGFWLDIGRHEDYAEAVIQYEELKDSFLPAASAASRNGNGNGNGNHNGNGNGNGNGALHVLPAEAFKTPSGATVTGT
jgi:NDP-sugar pyrophosphorylase family protein